MTDAVERVAKAMANYQAEDSWPGLPEWDREDYRVLARGALGALGVADLEAKVEDYKARWARDNTCGICPYRETIQASNQELREADAEAEVERLREAPRGLQDKFERREPLHTSDFTAAALASLEGEGK